MTALQLRPRTPRMGVDSGQAGIPGESFSEEAADSPSDVPLRYNPAHSPMISGSSRGKPPRKLGHGH